MNKMAYVALMIVWFGIQRVEIDSSMDDYKNEIALLKDKTRDELITIGNAW